MLTAAATSTSTSTFPLKYDTTPAVSIISHFCYRLQARILDLTTSGHDILSASTPNLFHSQKLALLDTSILFRTYHKTITAHSSFFFCKLHLMLHTELYSSGVDTMLIMCADFAHPLKKCDLHFFQVSSCLRQSQFITHNFVL